MSSEFHNLGDTRAPKFDEPRQPQQPRVRKNFIARDRNQEFVCGYCSGAIAHAPRTIRNHCPTCLYSKHVDNNIPGDRASSCGALMKPTQVEFKKGAYAITHTCIACGKTIRNKTSEDDNMDMLITISTSASQ